MKYRRLGIIILSLFCMAGCVAIPEYKQTATEINGAYLIPKVETSKIVSAVAIVSVFDDPVVCGEPLSNLRHLFKISQRNPLVSDLNADGVWVPADVKLRLSVMILLDNYHCGRVFSFTPKRGDRYRLDIQGKSMPYAAATCEVSVVTTDSAGNQTSTPPDFQGMACTPTSASK